MRVAPGEVAEATFSLDHSGDLWQKKSVQSQHRESFIIMKGIILAGGSGTRLYPITKVVSKQLMPVYDKPMIFYPLSTLMLAGIKDILIITTPEDQAAFKNLLKDGSQWGINLCYEVQPSPDGLPQAFIVGEKFIGKDPVCLILGDNIFFAQGLAKKLQHTAKKTAGATIFAYMVNDSPRDMASSASTSTARSTVSKKAGAPEVNHAMTGLFFMTTMWSNTPKISSLPPVASLKITDLNRIYLEKGQLDALYSPVAPPGSIPAPSLRCSTLHSLLRSSKSGRASKSPVSRK
ncbi:hypothetical protein MASR1M12_24760 [Erysipelotrichia bacterium]